MTDPTGWLLQNALVATVGALALAAILRLRRPAPGVEHVLWALLAVKFLLPPLVPMPVNVPVLQPLARPFAEVAETRFGTSAAVDGGAVPAGVADESRPARPGEPQTASSGAWNASAAILLGVSWAVGATGVLAMRVSALVRWRRRRRLTAAPAWLRALVVQVAGDMGVALPRVYVDDTLGTPLITGLIRPRLLWPAHLLDGLRPERARTVVAHEVAHLRRGDLWLGLFEFAADAVWWWYPGWYFVRRRLRDASERACDAVVVRQYPHLRRAYAEGLLDVAAAGRLDRPAMALGLDGPGSVHRRLYGVLGKQVRTSRRRAGLLIALLAVFILPAWRVAPAALVSYEQRTGQDPVITALNRAAADSEPAVRRAAANALRDIGGVPAENVLRTLTVDPDPDVRRAARSALGLEVPRPNLVFPESRSLASAAQNEVDSLGSALAAADAGARLNAARRLGNLRDRRSVPVLVTALSDSRFEVRQAAADALGNIEDPVAASALTALLDDPHPRVRQSAASAVGRTGGMNQVPSLAGALEDPDAHVRQSATSALGTIGRRRAP